MKIKLLIVLSLAALLLLGGCRGDSNANTANTANMNTNMAVNTATPVTRTNESGTTDTVLKSKVETALKGKGFNDVTVDVTTTPATLRGTVPKGKLAEAVQTAQEAAGKPLSNQLTEK